MKKVNINDFKSSKWLDKLARLKVDRASGDPSPHKPLLLLIIIELAEQGSLSETLALSPTLAFRFFSLWGIVAHRRSQKPDIRLPFHHLQGDKCCSALDEDGNPSPDRKFTRFIRFSSDFYILLGNREFRNNACKVLISKYFEPEERIALYSLYEIRMPNKDDDARAKCTNEKKSLRIKGRDIRFRIDVVSAYNYSCALTGYRLNTIMSSSIVDAAHIHQFADSRNNNLTNGIALCKNAHWSFDMGLWTISNDYRIIVAIGNFSESSPNDKPLLEYHGQKLLLPKDNNFWPNPIHLTWHRKNKFIGIN